MRIFSRVAAFIILSLLTQAALAQSFIQVAQVSAGASSSIQFTNIQGYHRYHLVIDNMQPSASSQNMVLRFGTNNGDPYSSNANYVFLISGASVANSTKLYGSSGANAAQINGGTVDNGQPLSGTIDICGMDNSGAKPFFQANLAYYSGGYPVMSTGGGSYTIAGIYDSLEIYMSGGATITGGTFTLYGLN